MGKKMMTAAVGLLLYVLLLTVPAYADNVATLSAVADRTQVARGETVTVRVTARQVTDLFGIQFRLQYDPQSLELQSRSYSGDYSDFRQQTEVAGERGDLFYPLLRKAAADKGYKEQVGLATFVFKALREGSTDLTLNGVKAVNTESYTNEQGRNDLRIVPIDVQGGLKLTVTAPSIPQQPNSSDSPGSSSAVSSEALGAIRGETDPLKAAGQLDKMLWSAGSGSPLSAGLARELEETLQQVVQQLIEFEAKADQLQPEAVKQAVQTAQKLLDSASGMGQKLQLPELSAIHVSLPAEGSGTVGLTGDLLTVLQNASLGIVLNGSDATLHIPLSAIYQSGQDGDVRLSLQRESGETVQSGAVVYRPATVYRFEAERVSGETSEQLDSLAARAALTLAYSEEASLDNNKLGLYRYDEASGTWQYVRSAKHNRENRTFQTEMELTGQYAIMEYSRSYSDTGDVYEQARRAIEGLTARHLLEGVDDSRYAPAKSLTRAEFAKLIVVAFGMEPAQSYDGKFGDVTADQWYAGYVQAAYQAGIVQGYDDGSFAPEEAVTREQMVVMLMRAYAKTYELPEPSGDSFADDETISEWAKGAIRQAKALGLISGVGGNRFDPADSLNRADAAVLLMNVLNRIE